MEIVLGIDAAWSVKQPSGVAMVGRRSSRWECLAVAPSYLTFHQAARGCEINWQQSKLDVDPPDANRLIAAASLMADGDAIVVAVDMPISTVEIADRRAADRKISQQFGAQGCSTHSPNAKHPGKLGANLSKDFHEAGFALATEAVLAGTYPRHLIEVYPHLALLKLVNRDFRVPYKVSKSSKYWKGKPIRERIELLIKEFHCILNGLSKHIDGIQLTIPNPENVNSLSSLKRYEDALDALVCCWVGCQYLEGKARSFGDDAAAIWCPT